MSLSMVWLHTDHLGSVRVKSSVSGQVIAGTRMAYHRFGERTGAKTDPVKYEFTGKERDSDTRLDYFGRGITPTRWVDLRARIPSRCIPSGSTTDSG
jgi:hypothetical protein